MSTQINRVVTIKRTFNADVKLVWQAWTEPGHISKWWGPKGIEINIIEHNFTAGGTWKYTMPMPDGNEFISEGKYTEIIPFKKIVTTADFKPMTEGVILEVILEKKGDQTDFTFNVIHETEAYKIQQEKMGIYNGWGSAFDRLESTLSE